jgi:hypothetical protein
MPHGLQPPLHAHQMHMQLPDAPRRSISRAYKQASCRDAVGMFVSGHNGDRTDLRYFLTGNLNF